MIEVEDAGSPAPGTVPVSSGIPVWLVLGLLVLTLLARVATAREFSWPGLMDPGYYRDVAHHLNAGEGLTTCVLWNFNHLPADVVHPACDYWGPVVPVLLATAFGIGGESLESGQAVSILFSLVLVLQALSLAWRLGLAPELAAAAALILTFSLQLNYFGVTFDTPTPFAVFANGCLFAQALALTRDSRYLFVAAPFGVLAQLTRADGLLLPVMTLVWGLWLAVRRRAGAAAFLMLVLLHLVLIAPWMYRNMVDFGRPFPSSVVQAVAMRDYSDLFKVGERPSLGEYLAQGPVKILGDKASVLVANLGTLTMAECVFLIWLLPFMLRALWRDPFHRPFLLYALGLLASLSLVFSFQSVNGSLIHSMPALYPYLACVAVAGGRELVTRVAGDLRIGRRVAFLLPWLYVLYTALFWGGSLVGNPDLGQPARDARAVGAALESWYAREAGEGIRLMSNDSLDMAVWLPAPVVQVPRDEGLSTTFGLAHRYKLSYLLEVDNPVCQYRPFTEKEYVEGEDRLVLEEEIPVVTKVLGITKVRVYRFVLATKP